MVIQISIRLISLLVYLYNACFYYTIFLWKGRSIIANNGTKKYCRLICMELNWSVYRLSADEWCPSVTAAAHKSRRQNKIQSTAGPPVGQTGNRNEEDVWARLSRIITRAITTKYHPPDDYASRGLCQDVYICFSCCLRNVLYKLKWARNTLNTLSFITRRLVLLVYHKFSNNNNIQAYITLLTQSSGILNGLYISNNF